MYETNMHEDVRQPHVWIDGELVAWDDATVHILSLGWSTISGLFESMRCYWNDDQQQLYAWQLPDHYKRFIKSQKMVRSEPGFTAEQLTHAAVELLRANNAKESQGLRCYCYHKDVTWFGANPGEAVSTYMQSVPAKSMMGANKVVAACISNWKRLSDNSMSPRIKCFSNYQNSRMAWLDAKMNGYDHAILLNENGYAAEGAFMCLCMVRDGVLITPDISSGILESCTRRAVLQVASEALGITVVERPVNRSEMYMCDELFFCGTGAEIMPVGSVDKHEIGDGVIGPVSQKIYDTFCDLMFGRDERYPEWRIPIY
jgi:branched-chain amino acid aminotransferase